MVSYLINEWKLSIRQACNLINFNRSSYYYKNKIDEEEVQAIIEVLISRGYTQKEITKLIEQGKIDLEDK